MTTINKETTPSRPPRGRTWTKKEDAVVSRHLLAAVEPFTNWASVAEELPGRTGRQVRDRWNNYLNPAINHEPFTREDDMKLWNGRQEIGSRWVDIAINIFDSKRSENQVKNRWYSAAFKKFIKDEFGAGAHDTVGQKQPARKKFDALETLVEQSAKAATMLAHSASDATEKSTDSATSSINPPQLGATTKPAAAKKQGGKKRRSPQVALQVTPDPKGGDNHYIMQHGMMSALPRPGVIHSKAIMRQGKGIQSQVAPMESKAVQILSTMEKHSVLLTPAQKQIVVNTVINFPLKEGKAPKGRSWTNEEDAILSAVVLAEADPPFTRWSDLAASRFPERTGKQVRDRWNNYLNPNINHSAWTPHEDHRLWKAHGEIGKKWTEIGIEKFHETRSENQIKNRWYSAAFKKFVAEHIGKEAYEGANKSALAKIAKKQRLK